MKFLCRYTNSETCSPTSYVIYERTYVCHRVCIRSFNFSKFVRTYGTCMHHDKLLFHTCIVSPLINLLLGYVTLIHYDFVSQELHMLLVQMAAPAGSENFLSMFGTPALLWRVLHYARYYEPPLYY